MDNTSENEERNLIINNLKQKPSKLIYLITILAAIGGFLFGYDTGVVSGAMILLKKHFRLNDIWVELIVSSTIGVAWIISLLAGILTDRFGRKPVIILASFVFTIGAVMMGLSRSKLLLLGGRIVIGIGIGLSSMTVPMYIGEIAPSDIRGKLTTINSCFITGGQFVASIVDGLFSEDEANGWRYMLAFAGIPSFIQFFSFLCMPESPRWLISKGYNQEALTVLQKVRGVSLAEQEFESIKSNFAEIEQEQQSDGSTSVLARIIHHSALRRALIVGCALQLFQQISGINTVMYYSATIIQMSGIGQNSKAIWLSSATAAVNFVCTFIGLFLVEKIGRRLLTIGSLTGVIFSLCVLAVGFQLADIHSPTLDYHRGVARNTSCSGASTCAKCINFAECGYCFHKSSSGPVNASCLQINKSNEDISLNGNCAKVDTNFVWAYEWCPTEYAWLILLGLLLYLFFFAPGMGPMPWTINSEIYPLWARSTCYSIATSVNWMFNLVISMTFLTLSHSITRYGAFYLYMVFAIIGWIFFFVMLPETKGKTLEEVENLFSHPLWKDMTTCSGKKTVQYVHIRGMGHSRMYNDPDSSEEN